MDFPTREVLDRFVEDAIDLIEAAGHYEGRGKDRHLFLSQIVSGNGTCDSVPDRIKRSLLALFEPLRAELEALRPVARVLARLLEGGHLFSCLAGQRGYGTCAELCIRARKALDALDPDVRARLLEGA